MDKCIPLDRLGLSRFDAYGRECSARPAADRNVFQIERAPMQLLDVIAGDGNQNGTFWAVSSNIDSYKLCTARVRSERNSRMSV